MSRTASYFWRAVPIVVAGLLAWPAAGAAQTLTGDAKAVDATVLGTATTLADTGPLASPSDPLEASLDTGAIPSVLSGEALHATTIGWTDQVASESPPTPCWPGRNRCWGVAAAAARSSTTWRSTGCPWP